MKIEPIHQLSIIPKINERMKAKWRKINAVEDRRQSSEDQQFQGISLRLRKFRWNCENFAIIAKISQS